jgi:glucose-6-phosphate isomerase
VECVEAALDVNGDGNVNNRDLTRLAQYLAGKNVEHCNAMAQLGTKLAHIDGGVPQIEVSIERIDAFNLGGLFYFFEFACGISAYVLGINPFNQPGVEAYKKNMFALLEKPGYEEQTKALKARL